MREEKILYKLRCRDFINSNQSFEDSTQNIESSPQILGTTITPIKALADEHNLYLHLKVEAPEGVVLPDLDQEQGYYYDFEPSCEPFNWKYKYEDWRVYVQYYFDDGYPPPGQHCRCRQFFLFR